MKKSLLVLVLMAITSTAFAGEKEVRATLLAHDKNIPITSIKPSGIPGLFEVVIGKRDIIYVEGNGKHVISGQLIDTKTNQNLTQIKIAILSKINWSDLNFANAFTIKKGDGSREFAIFTDPDCPYCKEFEKLISSLDNYTMHVFLMPIKQLHPEAETKASQIWCATDKDQAWHNYMLEGKLPEGKWACETPIEHNLEFAQKIGIQGTPTIILKNGMMGNGVRSKEQFDSLFKK